MKKYLPNNNNIVVRKKPISGIFFARSTYNIKFAYGYNTINL